MQMTNVSAHEPFRDFSPLLARFARNNDIYGDEYPVILYDPDINTQTKRVLKDFDKENSTLNIFTEFKEALKFAQSLGISFILITTSDYDEQMVIRNFQNLEYTYGRTMFDFEEKERLEDIFKNISNSVKESLKGYVFMTLLDIMMEAPVNEDEEEVMVMGNINEMASQFCKDFIIIWYDPQAGPVDKTNFEEAVEIEIQKQNIYKNFDDLWLRVQKNDDLPYYLIFCGNNGVEKIVQDVGSFQNLLGLYIYYDCSEMIEVPQGGKVKVQKTLKELFPIIKEDIKTKSKLRNTFPAFATDFDAIDKSHLYNTHYYLKGHMNFKNRKQARTDFVKLARMIHRDENQYMERFETYDEYKKEDIIKWYTKDSPIYRLLNNCLRISSSDSILSCRFALKDMETAIREEYKEKGKDFHGVVYRGAYISQEEWEKLQKNTGQEIEMYGFLSTSVKKRNAENFFKGDPGNKIFLTIIVPPLPELDEQGFADVSEFSDFRGEKEILFNVRSKFRILETKISKIDNRGTKCRHLVLLYGVQSLRKYMTQKQPTMQVELTLPADMKCDQCELKKNLFGFNHEKTEVRCIDCLRKTSVPKNTPLVALESEKDLGEGQKIIKTFKGQLLAWSQPVSFSSSGYKCYKCEKIGRKKYYKWICLKEQKMIEECEECFEKNIQIEYDILLSEENPYTMWQECQTTREEIDSNYQTGVANLIKGDTQGDVFMETQNFKHCIIYGERVISKLKRRRCREREKLKIFTLLGEAYRKLGSYQQALISHKKAHDLWKNIFGETYPETGASYACISVVYESLGEYKKAIKSQKEALNIQEAISGETHPDVAAAYNNLASFYAGLGRDQEAIESHKKAQEIWKRIYGENDPITATSYNNIAFVYVKLGKHQEALENFQKAKDVWTAIYGEKHPNTATACNNLGSLHQELGNSKKALNYYNQALETRKAIYGENHAETAVSFNNLGEYHQRLGEYYNSLEEYKQAFNYYQKALKIRRSIFGEEHVEVGISYDNIGQMYQKLGEKNEALACHTLALSILEAIYGENHLDIATVYNSLAHWYESFGTFDQAYKLYVKSLNIMRHLFGENHCEVAIIYYNLGCLCRTSKENEKALEYSKKALEIWIKTFGENHKNVASAYSNLAIVYKNLRQDQKAQKYQKQASDIQLRILKMNEAKNQRTAFEYSSLAFNYIKLGQYQTALECQEKALEISLEINKEEHEYTATSYENLVAVYRSLKQDQKALEFQKKALAIRLKVNGEKHQSTASTYTGLALAYMKLEQYQDALECQKKALDISLEINKEKHEYTAASYEHLASVYSLLEKPQEAMKFQFKAQDITIALKGEQDMDKIIQYENLVSELSHFGKRQQALEYSRKALDLRSRIYGETHPQTAAACERLGDLYQRFGNKQESFKWYMKSCEITTSYIRCCEEKTSPK